MANFKLIFLTIFMMVLYPINDVFCAVGQMDTRKYVDWNSEPYNNYVRIVSGGGIGTGEFIDYKYILTNKHVAKCCGVDKEDKCEILTSDNKKLWGKVVATGGGLSDCKFDSKKHQDTGLDWAIIEIQDINFVQQRKINNKNGFDMYAHTTQMNNLKRAGFGTLRVLSDKDIQTIKTTYQKWLRSDPSFVDVTAQQKVSKNGVNLAHGNTILDTRTADYKSFLNKYQEFTGKNFVSEYLTDYKRFKVVENCNIISRSQNQIQHTCTSWPGDSGSALLDASNKIVGIHNSGFMIIGTTKPIYSSGLPVDDIAKVVKELKSQNKQNVQSRNVNESCIESDLPSHAISGVYINSGNKKLDCNNGIACSCAAQKCESGYYLVVNTDNITQGWCYTRKCPDGQHLNIIDNIKTDTNCVDN